MTVFLCLSVCLSNCKRCSLRQTVLGVQRNQIGMYMDRDFAKDAFKVRLRNNRSTDLRCVDILGNLSSSNFISFVHSRVLRVGHLGLKVCPSKVLYYGLQTKNYYVDVLHTSLPHCRPGSLCPPPPPPYGNCTTSLTIFSHHQLELSLGVPAAIVHMTKCD